VRRPNGLPLSFPVWMTELTAAQIEIVREPRLTLSTLLDLRHLVTPYLSSLGSTDSEGSHDAAARSRTGATSEDDNFVRVPPLPKEVAQQAAHGLAVDESAGEGDGCGGER
jgi:hypothetical protein